MKRWWILLFVLLCVSFSTAYGIETSVGGGYAMLSKMDTKSVSGYYVTVNGVFFDKSNIGFSTALDVSYLYSNGFKNVNEEQQILRQFVVLQKNIHTVWENKVTKDTVISIIKWNVFFSFGKGDWTFIRTQTTNEPNGNDETFGAFLGRLGFEYRDIFLMLSCDIVQVPGPDIVVPSIGIKIRFDDK